MRERETEMKEKTEIIQTFHNSPNYILPFSMDSNFHKIIALKKIKFRAQKLFPFMMYTDFKNPRIN